MTVKVESRVWRKSSANTAAGAVIEVLAVAALKRPWIQPVDFPNRPPYSSRWK
jgi:hypothetical protein